MQGDSETRLDYRPARWHHQLPARISRNSPSRSRVQVNGRIEHGVVYDVIREELFTAPPAARAPARRSPDSCQRPDPDLERALIGTGIPVSRGVTTRLEPYLNMLEKVILVNTSGIRRPGAAALDLCLCRRRSPGRILGDRSGSLGSCGGRTDRTRSGRYRQRARRRRKLPGVPGTYSQAPRRSTPHWRNCLFGERD